MLFVLLLAALAPARRDPRVEAIVQRIEPAPLQATVAKLVSFGTRHTLSDTTSETRGIGAARTAGRTGGAGGPRRVVRTPRRIQAAHGLRLSDVRAQAVGAQGVSSVRPGAASRRMTPCSSSRYWPTSSRRGE